MSLYCFIVYITVISISTLYSVATSLDGGGCGGDAKVAVVDCVE